MSAEGEERGFLGRWAARKRGSDAVPPDADTSDASGSGAGISTFDAPDESSRPAGVPDGGAAAKASGTRPDTGPETDDPLEPPPLSDADMPPVESLDATSDLSGFFSKGVSATLRRAALRHVFAQPSYNVRDGLNDYDGDYTVFEPLGDTVTSDMKFHATRHERERLRREAQAKVQAETQAEMQAETQERIETSSTDGAQAEGPTPDEPVEGRGADVEREGAGGAHGTERDDRRRSEETTTPSELTSIGTDERPPNGTRTGRADENGEGDAGRDASRDENEGGTGHG